MSPYADAEVEALIGTVARKFAMQKNELAVRILAESRLDMEFVDLVPTEVTDYEVVIWSFYVPEATWLTLGDNRATLENELTIAFKNPAEAQNLVINSVRIVPETTARTEWREVALNWLRRDGVTNQGRARSTNVAPIEHDGLLFRSRAEVNLYDALKKTGVTFAPLPVFIRGGANYRRIEPDFIIISKGIVLHVEIDGDTIDHGTPLEADRRISILKLEGVITERVSASECSSPELAHGCADKLVRLIDRHKASR